MSDDRGTLVDLGLRRAQQRKADVRVVIELWRLGDGRVACDYRVEEFKHPDGPGLPMAWFREHIRWAVLLFSATWRLGLRRRPKSPRRPTSLESSP